MAKVDLAKLVLEEYNSFNDKIKQLNLLEYLSIDCSSVCMECGQTISFIDLIIENDYCYFSCSSCHENVTMADFLLNFTLTNPTICIFCKKDIDLWDVNCKECHAEFNSEFWLNYIAIELELIGYQTTVPIESLHKIYKQIFSKDAYTNYLEELEDYCFICAMDVKNCYCITVFETFVLDDVYSYSDYEITNKFYDVGSDINQKIEYSCLNCKKFLSTACSMLPSMLLTMASRDDEPKFKVSTCEFQSPKQVKHDF